MEGVDYRPGMSINYVGYAIEAPPTATGFGAVFQRDIIGAINVCRWLLTDSEQQPPNIMANGGRPQSQSRSRSRSQSRSGRPGVGAVAGGAPLSRAQQQATCWFVFLLATIVVGLASTIAGLSVLVRLSTDSVAAIFAAAIFAPLTAASGLVLGFVAWRRPFLSHAWVDWLVAAPCLMLIGLWLSLAAFMREQGAELSKV